MFILFLVRHCDSGHRFAAANRLVCAHARFSCSQSLFAAEGIVVLIAAAIPIFIVGIAGADGGGGSLSITRALFCLHALAAGAFTFGGFMCVMGYFIKIEDVGACVR